MKVIKIWLNHWFSTAYHIINLLKTDGDTRFIFIGSNTDSNCVYRAVCDEWETESIYDNSDQYIEFCLEFCQRHKVNVFLPRRNMQSVSRRIADFDAIGVKVLVERDYTILKALCDKIETYNLFKRNNIGNVPEFRAVYSVNEFINAYRELKQDDNRICLKLSSDEGAASFRVIDDRIEHKINESVGSKITYKHAIEALSHMKTFRPLLVMPYLTGVEVSADCLYMPDGNHIVIPRYKSHGRSEEIVFEDTIVDTSMQFLDRLGLMCPCNIQFKYESKTPYLLEVNTRMSGGIQLSCIATGVNIPSISVNRLLGKEMSVNYDKSRRIVSYVETPIIIE